MNTVREISRLNALELEKCVPPEASWHTDYRDTAYVHIGSLSFSLTEGDILTIFSQYGTPTFLHLVRDKETGKSKGFGWLKYEDQRSCDLAVDNLGGASILGRTVRVDHARYQQKEGEGVEGGVNVAELDREDLKQEIEGEESEEDGRELLREEVELRKLIAEHDEDDPMKGFLIEEKKAEVAKALRRMEKEKKRAESGKGHRHRHGRRPERERERRVIDDGYRDRNRSRDRSTRSRSRDRRKRSGDVGDRRHKYTDGRRASDDEDLKRRSKDDRRRDRDDDRREQWHPYRRRSGSP